MKTALQAALGLTRYRALSQTVNSLKRIVRLKHEPEIFALSKIIRKGDVVCEIGANYAQYSRILSTLVGPTGQVLAFEPAAITYKCLPRNCRILRLHNVYPQKLALADKPGRIELHTPIKRNGVFGVAQASLAPDPTIGSLTESVSVETLDAFLSNHAVAPISFIRCDVEGAEFSVFLGARETFGRYHLSVLVEVHPEMMQRFGHSVAQLQRFLANLGYRFPVWADGSFKLVESLGSGNVFCFATIP